MQARAVNKIRIGVIGLGTMGAGTAAVLERAGMSVRAFDNSKEMRASAPDRAKAAREALDKLGLPDITPAEPLTIYEHLRDAVSGVDLVIEIVPENLALKRNVLSEVARHADTECVIASGTSGIPIGELQRGVRNSGRVIGMHWSNPPHLIPVIEIIPGAHTAPETVDWMTRFVKTIRMVPIRLKKDVPGFVENRILYAIIREAIDLVERDVIDPENLDTCVSWGIGFKLSVIGPLALLDVAGLDIYQSVAGYLNKELSNRSDVPELVSSRTREGKLGLKTGAGVFDYTNENIEALRISRVAKLIAARGALEADE